MYCYVEYADLDPKSQNTLYSPSSPFIAVASTLKS